MESCVEQNWSDTLLRADMLLHLPEDAEVCKQLLITLFVMILSHTLLQMMITFNTFK